MYIFQMIHFICYEKKIFKFLKKKVIIFSEIMLKILSLKYLK